MQIARVHETIDGQPSFEGHETLTGPERARVLAYLRSGHQLHHDHHLAVDVLDPARGEIVPTGIRTDGHWIWSSATRYYLEAHGFGPEPGLLAHIRSQGYLCHTPNQAQVDDAVAALDARFGAWQCR